MIEEILVTTTQNSQVHPHLSVWSWEIPIYLDLGGLTAGILVLGAVMVLLGREADNRFAVSKLPLWAPIVLSVGMLMLFLDLSVKENVLRFYGTFRWTSPMSWGSWALLLVYPVAILMVLVSLREGYPRLARILEAIPGITALTEFARARRRGVALFTLLVGVFLGLYTGILLSSYVARPFWNSGVLPLLFLASGLSAGAAVTMLLARDEGEQRRFAQIVITVLSVKLVLVALYVINLATGSRAQIDSLQLIFDGPFTTPFWVLFVGVGIVLPIILIALQLRIGRQIWMLVTPVLVIFGGYTLRDVMVKAGQMSTFRSYENVFDPALLSLLQ